MLATARAKWTSSCENERGSHPYTPRTPKCPPATPIGVTSALVTPRSRWTAEGSSSGSAPKSSTTTGSSRSRALDDSFSASARSTPPSMSSGNLAAARTWRLRPSPVSSSTDA